MKKLLSCFAVVVLVLCFVAASSSVAQAQRAAIGFQFASNLQAPLYGATGKSDSCLAVFLLDQSGRIQYVRWGFVGTFTTVGISTGKYVPVFAAYTAAAPAQYPIQRCADLPTAATLITDPALEPKLWLSLAPRQNPGRIDIDQANVGAILGVAQILSAFAVQSVDLTQINVANVNTATGFGGVSEVTFENTPNITLLLSRLSSCSTPAYITGLGYGETCNPAQQP